MAGRDGAVTGAVIAGGASRRMGTDKRGLSVGGAPMLRRTALAVRRVSDELLIACRREAPPDPAILAGLGARLVFDRLDDAGPLAGVEAALAGASGDLVLVVAGDMPWVEPAVLRVLVAAAREDTSAGAAALVWDRGPEPLLAVYRRDVLPVASGLLDGGVRRMHALLEALRVAEVGEARWREADPRGWAPRNVNTSDDLRAPEEPAAG